MAAGDALLLTSQFAAAGLFLLLAVVLLAVRFNSRVNRAFAIFLLLRGTSLLLQAFARVPGYADEAATLFDVARYFVLATPFVLLYFVVLYRTPNGSLAARVTGVIAILLVIAVETLFLVDHCLVTCPERPGENGFLNPVVQSTPLAEGLVALVLAVTARAMGSSPRARSTTLVAAAFTLLGLLEGAQIVSVLLTDGRATFTDANTWLAVARVMPLLGFVAATTALVILLTVLKTTESRALLVASSLVVVATTLYQLYAEDRGQAYSQVLSYTTALFGTWRLMAAAIVAYALIRHRFLDLDLKINWTISRGTVLAVLLATFIIVFQVVENMLDDMLGIVFGGVATGVMLLAIRPLERLGDRVAAKVHPRGSPAILEASQRMAIFQEQATLVWADGHIGRKERLLLDNLRDRLQLDVRIAAHIEHQAALQTGTESVPSELSTQT